MSISGCMDKDVVCIHNGVVFSHKKREILPFVTLQIDFEDIMLNEISDRERQIPRGIIYMWNLKKKKKANS